MYIPTRDAYENESCQMYKNCKKKNRHKNQKLGKMLLYIIMRVGFLLNNIEPANRWLQRESVAYNIMQMS